MIDFSLYNKSPEGFDMSDDSQFKDLDINVNFKIDDFTKYIKESNYDVVTDNYNSIIGPITTAIRCNDIADMAADLYEKIDSEGIEKLINTIHDLDFNMYQNIINFIFNYAKAKADVAMRNSLKRIEIISATGLDLGDEEDPEPIFNDEDKNEDESTVDLGHNEDYNMDIMYKDPCDFRPLSDEEREMLKDKLENEGIEA